MPIMPWQGTTSRAPQTSHSTQPPAQNPLHNALSPSRLCLSCPTPISSTAPRLSAGCTTTSVNPAVVSPSSAWAASGTLSLFFSGFLLFLLFPSASPQLTGHTQQIPTSHPVRAPDPTAVPSDVCVLGAREHATTFRRGISRHRGPAAAAWAR